MTTSAFNGRNHIVAVIDHALTVTTAHLAGFRAAARVARSALPHRVEDGFVLNRRGLPCGIDVIDEVASHLNLAGFAGWKLSPEALTRLDAQRSQW